MIIVILTTGMLVTVHSVGIDTLLMSHINNNNQAQQTGGFAIQLATHKCREERRDLNNLAQDTVTDSTINMDLDNYYNMCYLAEMNVGTPPQPITVLLDTGSAHTWMLTEEANRQLGYDQFYDGKLSSTFHDPQLGIRIGIQFGIGGLNGYFVEDTLVLGDNLDPTNRVVMESFRFGYTLEATVF